MYKLIRERDGLTKISEKIIWIEFDDFGRFKDRHDKPSVNRSLLMSPFNFGCTWQTTEITEILEETDDLVKFKTKNSIYILKYEK